MEQTQTASANGHLPVTTPDRHGLTPFSLAGKRALITGGGSGIGFAIAQCMIEAGATVVITGRREDALRDATAQLGEQAQFVANDVTERDKLDELIDTIEQRWGPVDILVNNAGVNMKKPAIDVSDADFDRIVQTNLNAVFSLSRACARRMLDRQSGCILMITSMAAYYGIDRVAAYGASKSAVEGMVRVLASEWSGKGVRVNAIAPGFIDTAMSRTAMNSDPDRRDRAMRRTPMGYFGQTEDIGWAAVFLASDAARYITGASLPVDGGNSIGF